MNLVVGENGSSIADRFKNFFAKAFGTVNIALLAAALLTGCSIHPVQQDVTGLRTPDLVDYLLCETRLAIQDKAIELLEEKDSGNPLTDDLKKRRGQVWGAEIRTQLNARERAFYDRYVQTGVAYDF